MSPAFYIHINILCAFAVCCQNMGGSDHSLGCNICLSSQTDALHQQQKTPTKAKPSDHLAAEQRRVSSGQQPPVKSKEKEQHVEVFDEKVTQGSRHNCHVLGYGVVSLG